MNVYRVVVERDGATTKEPGKTSTDINRESHYYGAESIEDVWHAIRFWRDDPEATIVGIILEHDHITMLAAVKEPK